MWSGCDCSKKGTQTEKKTKVRILENTSVKGTLRGQEGQR